MLIGSRLREARLVGRSKIVERSKVKWKQKVQKCRGVSGDHHLVNRDGGMISRDNLVDVIWDFFGQSECSIRKYGCKDKLNSMLGIKVVFLIVGLEKSRGAGVFKEKYKKS